jgi:hypothetical protein
MMISQGRAEPDKASPSQTAPAGQTASAGQTAPAGQTTPARQIGDEARVPYPSARAPCPSAKRGHALAAEPIRRPFASRHLTFIAAAALSALVNAACAPNSGSLFKLNLGSPFKLSSDSLFGLNPVSGITLVSYKDPYFPEPIDVPLNECTYQKDPRGDLQIVARDAAAALDTAGPLERLLHIHVYWQPYPGKTFSNSSTTTATIRYIVATREGTVTYTGTGFAYPAKRSGDGLEIDLESANLQLDTSTGTAPEMLGLSRLTGKLFARHDPHRTVDLMRQVDLLAAGNTLP